MHRPDYPFPETEELPALEVFPHTLWFEASLGEGSAEHADFTVRNNLDRGFDIWGYTEVVPKTAEDTECAAVQFEVLSPVEHPGITWLGPREEITFTVRFTPSADDFCGAQIDVNTLPVDLDGWSLRSKVSHSSFPHLNAQVGCEARGTFVLRNTFGTEPLVIYGAETEDMGPFSLPEGLPQSIPPGEEAPIVLDFRPRVLGDVHGALVLHTNDPDHEVLNVFLSGLGTDDLTRTESFHYLAGDGAQVLLVVDDEDADAAYMSRVEAGLTTLVDDLRGLGIAYNIAAVSTEDGCPGAVSFATHHETAAEAVSALSSAIFDDEETTWADRLPELAALALENTDPGDCLDGFIEADQPLHVIFVSPREMAAEGQCGEHIAALQGLHDDLTLSVIAPGAGESCGVGSNCLKAAAGETGGAVLDMCAPSSEWQGHWQTLAGVTARLESGPTSLILAEEPVADTLEVAVQGATLPEAYWTFDDDANEVRAFLREDGEALVDGDKVDVRYTPVDACP